MNNHIIALAAAIGLAFGAMPTKAGSDIEHIYMGTYYDRQWLTSVMPLEWSLHEDGVVNNGGIVVTNAQAEAALTAAFNVWNVVPTSSLNATYLGETATGTVGCDFENVVTWSDSTPFPALNPGVLAVGITTVYEGPEVVLDDVNRVDVGCVDISDVSTPVTLDPGDYPNGLTLRPGTILDMDMAFYSGPIFFLVFPIGQLDWVTTPNTESLEGDIQAIGAHEFGHLFGLSHSSLAYAPDNDRVTMYPIANISDVTFQNNVRTLELDDIVSVGRNYPSTGFWPTGTAPYTTGAITGNVSRPDGTAALAARVWAYSTADLTVPVVEAFTAMNTDADPAVGGGDYILPGLPPGDYYVCVLPWENGVPDDDGATAARYTLSTSDNNVEGNSFYTECYDDTSFAQDGEPNFGFTPNVVTVAAGATTPNIDITVSTKSDIIIVMDRSGSMNADSGDGVTSKVQALRDAADEFIDYIDLAGGHRIGLVQFEEVLQPLTPVFDLTELTAGNVGDAHTAVSSVMAGGWTNIITGVDEGVEQLTDILSPNPRQIILLFSDGKHNRPVGSDLNTIEPMVVDNDIELYSVGFGTDVDDAILSSVAAASGGYHVNEQDLMPIDLSKEFLAIAALAVDDSVMVDPTFMVTSQNAASLEAAATSADNSVTFALNWTRRDKDLLNATVIAPSGCEMQSRQSSGLHERSGETYKLMRVSLPARCNDKKEHAGVWRVVAKGRNFGPNDVEQVDIAAFGQTALRFFADARPEKDGVVVTAKLVDNGKILRKDRASIAALVDKPLPRTDDSERQDAIGSDQRIDPPSRAVRPGILDPKKGPASRKYKDDGKKPVLQLRDDGKWPDRKAGDGHYAGFYKAGAPGPYRFRLIGKTTRDGQTLTREKIAGATVTR